MAYVILFAALALAELVSVALVFAFRDVMHSVLALASSAAVVALLFLALQQPLLALLQLLIMVGGVATYLFVSVSSLESKRFRHTHPAMIAVLSLVLFAALYAGMYGLQLQDAHVNLLTPGVVGASLSSSVALLYIATLMLFGIGLAAIALLRKVK